MLTDLLTATALLAWAAGYGLACWIWPYAACLRCSGAGKLRSPSGRAYRKCPRCRGTGRRLRIGRWLLNHASTVANRRAKW